MIYYARHGMGTRYDPKTNKVPCLGSMSSDMENEQSVCVLRVDQRLKKLMEYPLVNVYVTMERSTILNG